MCEILIEAWNWSKIYFMDFFRDLSLVIASFVAIYGINSWRRELKGKKEFELAEQVLSYFYEAKDNIKMIRSPFSFGGEGATRKRSKNETERESKILDKVYVVTERYQKVQSRFNELFSLKYRFMAYFGREKEAPFVALNKLLNEIFVAARMLGTFYWQNQNNLFQNEDERKTHNKKMFEQERIFWDTGEDDKINTNLKTIIDDIEKICKKIMKVESL